MEAGEDCKICKLIDIICNDGAVLGRESLFFDKKSQISLKKIAGIKKKYYICIIRVKPIESETHYKL